MASRAIRINQAAAGRAHTLFLSDSGMVYSCGSNESAQQGREGFSKAPEVCDNNGKYSGNEKRDNVSGGDVGGKSGGSNSGGGGGVNGGGSSGGSGGGGDIRGGSEDKVGRDVLAPTAVSVPGSALYGLRVESVAAGDDHCTVVATTTTVTTTTTAGTSGTNEKDAVGGNSGGDGGGVGNATDDEGGGDRKNGGGGSGYSAEGGRRRVFTWGLNAGGQCVQGRAAEVVRAPQEAELLSGVRSVGCGAGHTMVVL